MIRPLQTLSSALAAAAIFALTIPTASAQSTPALQPRITTPIDNANRVTLTGSRSPLANPAADIGAVSPSMKLNGITLVFSRTPAQQAALDALVAAQQTPTSPLYHRWLTPDQFAARFGVADADIATVENWLQLQGFSIDGVSRSRDRITFSGTAALVASAFGSPLHYFKSTTSTGVAAAHFAPANDLTLPAALASSVLAITNLSDFRVHSHIKHAPPVPQPASAGGVKPNFTSSETGNHYLTPGDLATIYDITPAYSAGFTGSNQSIAVLGQSAVVLSDITNFQTAVNIPAKTPELVLVPNSGASTIYNDGDEGESDLDLEYTSTIAKGAQIFFVYTGGNSNNGVFDALAYAIDERIAPIISMSYGDCEPDLGVSLYNTFNSNLEQAAAQGQTVIAAAGDAGSTDCYGIEDNTVTTLAEQEALAADFPSTSQYVTGLGGTEFPAADLAPSSTYFTPQGSADVISSALSYIPEQVWNDDAGYVALGSTDPIGAGGGGVSIYTPRPSWQSATIGGVAIPSGTFRLTPDLSLYASPGVPDVAAGTIYGGLAFCTSDATDWSEGQVSSCTSGLRDASSGALTVAGGTSFDAPTFSGMLALIEQSQNSTGEGVINPTLYTLAANSTAGASEYPSATGYDSASGLGSVDLYKLLTAWPTTSASALAESLTTLVPVTSTPATGASDVITITVSPVTTNATTPTGTVALIVDGAPVTTSTTLTLTNGVATYTFPPASATPGSHIINATYSGDTTFGPSTASLTLTVAAPTVGSFTLTAANATVASGGTVTTPASAIPAGGYTGTILLSVTIPNNLTYFCIDDASGLGEIIVTGTSAVADNLTLYTSAATCQTLGLTVQTSSGLPGGSHTIRIPRRTAARTVAGASKPQSPWTPLRNRLPIPAALAGTLLLFGLGRRRSGKSSRALLRAGLTLGILVTLSLGGLTLTACSSSATSPIVASQVTPAGTYAITLTGQDTVNAAQTASVNFTLTVN
jgi:subtilase family serine protease